MNPTFKTRGLCMILAAFSLFTSDVGGQDTLIEQSIENGDYETWRSISEDSNLFSFGDRLITQDNSLGDINPEHRLQLRVHFDDTLLVSNAEIRRAFSCRWILRNENATPPISAFPILNPTAKVILADGSEQMVNASVVGRAVSSTGQIYSIEISCFTFDDLIGPVKSIEFSCDLPAETYGGIPLNSMPQASITRSTIFVQANTELQAFESYEAALDHPALLSKPPIGALDDLVAAVDLVNLVNSLANSLDAKFSNALESYLAETPNNGPML